MFNRDILEILKRNDRENKFDTYGSPTFLKGGIRYGLHPTPEMDFQPDNLYTGEEMYDDIKPRMIGGRMVGLTGGKKSIGKQIVKGLKKVGKAIAPIAKDVVMPVGKDFATTQGRKLLEQQLAKYALPAAEGALMVAAGRHKKSGGRLIGGAKMGGDKRSARAALVRKVMRENGCSLPEASRYIKENAMSY
jgi:hypothetical protein